MFPAGTPVLSDKGYTPIEELRPGDRVVSFHEERGSVEVSRVSRIHSRTAPSLVEIRLIGGGTVEATPGHPFYCVNSRSWVAAGELRSGSYFLLGRGQDLRRKGRLRHGPTGDPPFRHRGFCDFSPPERDP